MAGLRSIAALVWFGLIVCSASSSSQEIASATAVGPAGGNLKLFHQVKEVHDGMPHAFALVLLNISDHDVRVPLPVVNCNGGSLTGWAGLNSRWTPLKVGEPGPPGLGCSLSSAAWPSLWERVKEWHIVRPGESIAFPATYLEWREGTYEFWASYTPPILRPGDKAALEKAGIDYPQARLESAHITFMKLR